jgi:hypothetical protein
VSDAREENVGDLTRGLFRDAAPLDERITEAIRRITNGCGSMRIPAESTDPDIVLSNCRSEIAALRTRVEALTRDRDAALALPVEPAKPDEVGRARGVGPDRKVKGLASYPVGAIGIRLVGHRTLCEVQRSDGKWALAIEEQGNFGHEITANGLDALTWHDTFDALLAAERAAKEGG